MPFAFCAHKALWPLRNEPETNLDICRSITSTLSKLVHFFLWPVGNKPKRGEKLWLYYAEISHTLSEAGRLGSGPAPGIIINVAHFSSSNQPPGAGSFHSVFALFLLSTISPLFGFCHSLHKTFGHSYQFLSITFAPNISVIFCPLFRFVRNHLMVHAFRDVEKEARKLSSPAAIGI